MQKNKRVFISGGNGVIGNYLVQLLIKSGATIFVGDLKKRPAHWPKEIIYWQGDLNTIPKDIIEDFAPEIFFHLAATFERSKETYEFWQENYQHNLNLSHYLMTLMKDLPSLEKVIFASSYLIYNPSLYVFDTAVDKPYTLKETDPIYPRNLTGVAKLNHEIELRFLREFKSAAYNICSARIYRSYGVNSRDIISRWIRMLLNGEKLTVYRKEGIFDYIYAGDVAEGLLRLSVVNDLPEVVNLGSGKSRRVTEVLDVLKKYFPNLQYQEVEADILYEASQADMSLFKRLTGWQPGNSIENTIPEMIAYEKASGFQTGLFERFSVLVSSSSKKVPLLNAVRNAARRLNPESKILGGDSNSSALTKYFSDAFWEMPALKNLDVKQVIQYCKDNEVKAIVPTRDGELLFWATHKQQLRENGIAVMVSPVKSVEICLDKLEFYRFCAINNLPCIYTSDSIFDNERFVVKERFGAGSASLGLNLAREEAMEHAKKLDSPIFQPYVAGNEYSVDIYLSTASKVKGLIVRRRDMVANGESVITTTVVHKNIETLSANLCELLKLTGHIVLQVMEDENSGLHIIECNPRFGGASTTSVAAGLDSFLWFLADSFGEDIENYSFIKSKRVKRQVRFPADMILDL